MAQALLGPFGLDLSARRAGEPQRSGPMTVLPLFGAESDGARFIPPGTGLKLSRVKGYGNLELECVSGEGVAIVPSHIGYIQDGAQNHAMCTAALLGAGQKRMFTDACCVQAGQGGYLEERDQWFFILPLWLREKALVLRGQQDYSKLWAAIARLNARFGLPDKGHLEQLISRKRPHLTQYLTRFERLPSQTGALFFLGGSLVGVELAPSADYFAEAWRALVCFSYGSEAMYEESQGRGAPAPEPLAARDLAGLKRALLESRVAEKRALLEGLARLSTRLKLVEEERYLSLTLFTALGEGFSGQLVKEGGAVVYASLFASPKFLAK
jgi:hypothetical protein